MNRVRAILLVLLVLATGHAVAATGRLLNLTELASGADAVAVVQARKVESFEANGRVLTRTTFAVEDVWKGVLGDSVEVVQLGGRVPNKVTRVAGIPGFSVGERAVVFLEKPSGAPHFVIYGLEQGKLPVSGNTVLPPVITLHLLGKDGQEAQPLPPQAFELDELRDHLSPYWTVAP